MPDNNTVIAKHTPGPWTVCRTLFNNESIGWHITAAPHGSIDPICCDSLEAARDSLSTRQQRSEAEERANVRLIAAAPDLLAELRSTTAMLQGALLIMTDKEARSIAMEQIRASAAAIARATGA